MEMLLALLGIAKAGGAYLPLDPEHPRDRLAGTIAETGLRLVLAQGHLADRLPQMDGVEIIAIEGWDLSGYSDEAPVVDWHPEGLAYCITTSGSTGKPKAVGNSHKGLLDWFWPRDISPTGCRRWTASRSSRSKAGICPGTRTRRRWSTGIRRGWPTASPPPARRASRRRWATATRAC
ncbi:AMP-binding protein [Inquilinus limosus]|uniref:AMP-binding protein n=1 Tax=Inquilinus limosus TaxID=171674 RepID=UPI003D219D41